MNILALETSAKSVSAAVVRNSMVLASSYCCTGLTHSRTLMPMVESMLKNAGLSAEEMDLIAVAAGPGSFTGLRIGVSAAKGLAWALDKPCAAVSTLEAMAHNITHIDRALLVCAMDARRGEIYNALFATRYGVPLRVTPDRAISLDALAKELRDEDRRIIVLGDGAVLCRDGLMARRIRAELAPPALRMQNAVGVAMAAQLSERISAQELAPKYLRPSQAERERAARLKKEANPK